MSYEPGRKLDGLISAYVFGAEPEWFKGIPAYSTDIAAAWLVIERIAAEAGLRLELRALQHRYRLGYRGYEVSFTGNRFGEPIVASTAAHAICLAALKAVSA